MTFAKMFRWVSIAPLGVPVVPPVYCSTATSSGESGARVSGRPAFAGHQVGERARALHPRRLAPRPVEYSATDVTMTCSSAVCVLQREAGGGATDVQRDDDPHARVVRDMCRISRAV